MKTRLALPALLLALAACASGPTAVGVTRLFDAESRLVRVRPPTRADPEPARAENAAEALPRFTADANAYLKAHPKESRDTRHVKAMLACALLRQARPEEAVAVLRGLRIPKEYPPRRESVLANCATYAASACRAAEARNTVRDYLDGKVAAQDLIVRHGSLIGIWLPDPTAPDYAKRLGEATEELRQQCESKDPDPERVALLRSRRAASMKRLVAAQIYDDAAQLLSLLPEPEDGPRAGLEATLASIACALFVLHGETMDELLPEQLPSDRKQWYLEHSWSVYRRAKRVAGHFLGAEARARLDKVVPPEDTPEERLYAALVSAEISATGWIATR